MIFTNAEASAQILSTHIHRGQVRRGGEPYALHCERVAMRVADAYQRGGGTWDEWRQRRLVISAAWLHDAQEDQSERWSVVAACLHTDLVRLVDALTHPPDEPYGDYIARVIAAGPNAARIKWADLCDNLSDRPSDAACVRYGQALDAIRAAFPCAAWQVQP